MATSKFQVPRDVVKKATYEVPDSISGSINGDFIVLVGFLSEPSDSSKLRLHGRWHDWSNFVEFPIKDVMWLATLSTDTSGIWLETTVYVSVATHLEFSNGPKYTSPAITQGLHLLARGVPLSIAATRVKVATPKATVARLMNPLARRPATYRVWNNSRGAASVPRLTLGYGDDDSLVSAVGVDAAGAQHSLAIDMFIGAIRDSDGTSRKRAIRHVQFAKDDEPPLVFSTLIGLERNDFRLAIGRAGLSLIFDLDISDGHVGSVTRTLLYDGVIYSSQEGAYVVSGLASTLTLPFTPQFWPYESQVNFFSDVLDELLAEFFAKMSSDLDGLSVEDGFTLYLTRRKLAILAAAAIAGVFGAVVGVATASTSGLLISGLGWGFGGFDATGWGMIAYDAIMGDDGGGSSSSSGTGGPSSTGSSDSPGSGNQEPKKHTDTKDTNSP